MPFARDAVGGIGSAQRDALINGDIIPNFGGFADDSKTMIDEQMTTDFGARVDIDGRHPA